MTFAPGKNAFGKAGNWKRDLDADLQRLVQVYDAQVLVSLLARHEYALYGISDLPRAAERYQLEFLHLPIMDGGTPPSVSEVVDFMPRILEPLRRGSTVVVHCRGGLGRTGLIAACCLTTVGHSPDRAIAMVRAERRSAIENVGQERFIGKFADAWKSREKSD